MTDKKPGQEKEVSPKGAVEVDEEKLDEAAGGLNYSKIEFDATLTVDPTNPNLSDRTTFEKKI